MATELPTSSTNGTANGSSNRGEAKFTVKTGLARMLKGGVIMDVVNAEQVSISES
jgi:pyridoxal 5'-phosphate synthase pdxS subunit